MTISSVRSPHDSEVFIQPEEASDGAGSDGASDSSLTTSSERAPRGFDRRKRIVLCCAACGGRNYRKTKARREGAEPIQLMKFCSTCNAHTPHREAV